MGVAGLRQGLQERGYVLGRNLLLEERYAEGDPSRTRDLITELLALGVDVLVTGDFALIQAHTLTATVPIVGVAGDFVGIGLAATLSRPGGNVTGLSLLSADLSPKWLELLQAAVPNLNRVAFLGDYSGLTAEEKRGLDHAALGGPRPPTSRWAARWENARIESFNSIQASKLPMGGDRVVPTGVIAALVPI